MKQKDKNKQKPAFHHHDTFTSAKYRLHHVTSNSLRFSWLYLHHRRTTRYAIAALIGFLMAFFVQILIKNTGLYNTGISAVTQGIARIVNGIMKNNQFDSTVTYIAYNTIFWGLFFIINIPLFILSYKKIGKTFTGLSFTYIAVETAFGFVFSAIPNIENVLLFGDTRGSAQVLEDGTKIIQNWLVYNGLNIIPLSYGSVDVFYNGHPLFLANLDPIKNLYVILSAIAFGIVSAACYSVLYIIGACSCGADFISFYFSVTKQQSVNKIIVIINTTLMLIGVLTGSYIASGVICNECWNASWLWSGTLIGSIINMIIFKVILSTFYPSTSMVVVNIYSNKADEIMDILKKVNYTQACTIYQAKGGYKGLTQYVMQTICMFSETNNLIHFIRKIDKDCMISVTKLRDADGNLRVLQTGSLEK